MIFTLTVNLLLKKVATIEKKERKVHKERHKERQRRSLILITPNYKSYLHTNLYLCYKGALSLGKARRSSCLCSPV